MQCSAALTQCDILDRMSAEAGVPGAVQTVLIPTNIDETPGGGGLVLFYTQTPVCARTVALTQHTRTRTHLVAGLRGCSCQCRQAAAVAGTASLAPLTPAAAHLLL